MFVTASNTAAPARGDDQRQRRIVPGAVPVRQHEVRGTSVAVGRPVGDRENLDVNLHPAAIARGDGRSGEGEHERKAAETPLLHASMISARGAQTPACQSEPFTGSYQSRQGSQGDPVTEEGGMRNFHLLAGGLALVLALAAVGGAAARSQATTIRIAANMTAANEVPAPKGDVSGARGTFTATLTKSGTGAAMAWRLEFSNLTGNATAAHIHVAARGQAGPVRVPLCAPCTSGMTGTANIDAAVLDAIQTDRAYANVHTPTNPAGEIRGQVEIVATVRTTLSASQERPRPRGKVRRARGTFTATVTKSGTSGVVTWRLTFSRLTGRAV